MRILALADIHGRKIEKPDYDVDVVFVAGDFTNADDPSFVEGVLDALSTTGAKIFAVPGNMDKKGVLEILENRGVSIHLKTVDVGGFTFVGLGGSNPTPFGTPFEMTDDEIEKELSKLSGDIAIFHPPPNGFFDWIGENSVGSMAVRKWMDEKKPKMLICAHIHEHQGVAKHNETLIVKLGTAMKGSAALIEIGEGFDPVIVRFVSI
ncbi:metallophosphoesterase family protein [Archaeoglobus veneficus]|uniref:Metallophosphoesterase n=1 Tax=Archaeoglobus veneficus (strain DSM 11195 / SNP6) TaxID=693661 RepID=F2KNZ5_ARCVS|nr:metallophosphoesterase [Archaeoglobus veneficus]AEA46303.1 metallophosphoesterase [Archaeoglobus veneficus SNP6]